MGRKGTRETWQSGGTLPPWRSLLALLRAAVSTWDLGYTKREGSSHLFGDHVAEVENGCILYVSLKCMFNFHHRKCTRCSIKHKFLWESEEVHRVTNLAASFFIPGPGTCREQVVILSHWEKGKRMLLCAFRGGRVCMGAPQRLHTGLAVRED